ncbi:MAG: ATP-dependent DNA helicase, partial [Proteobacteria bacterium]|nr:ATP-dependent DNA helicase [Pseudomonadota bacterium]
ISSIVPVLRQVNGRSMILLTSQAALLEAADQLRDAQLGLRLLVQGEQPPAVLMNSFLKQQPAVLLGMATFWEGVDIRGSRLVFVAIDKLPFEYQNTPVNIKRQQFMASREQNFFKDYLLPKAVLRLKQGSGRLIRDHKDHGIVAIGDERLVRKSYGKTFLKSLPPFRFTRDDGEVMEFAIKHCADISSKPN